MWDELGISGGTAIIVLVSIYYVIKWAVKNGVKEALDLDNEYMKKFIDSLKNDKE